MEGESTSDGSDHLKVHCEVLTKKFNQKRKIYNMPSLVLSFKLKKTNISEFILSHNLQKTLHLFSKTTQCPFNKEASH